MKRQRHIERAVRTTCLIVGEGDAEVALIQHLKSLYLSRGSMSVTVRNAKGKGGAGVLNYTARQVASVAGAYDHVVVLLDTDTDWNDATVRRAEREGYVVVASSPCLEATLLRLLGQRASTNSADCKAGFSSACSGTAHDPQVYARHFTRQVLEGAIDQNPLRALIDLLSQQGIKPPTNQSPAARAPPGLRAARLQPAAPGPAPHGPGRRSARWLRARRPGAGSACVRG